MRLLLGFGVHVSQCAYHRSPEPSPSRSDMREDVAVSPRVPGDWTPGRSSRMRRSTVSTMAKHGLRRSGSITGMPHQRHA